jgi:DnaK suppressor protein
VVCHKKKNITVFHKNRYKKGNKTNVRDDIDLEFFETRLRKRLLEIETGLATGKDETAPKGLDQGCIGRLSRMDAMQQQAMAKATAQLSIKEKIRIQKALDRMKSGDYGYCLNCDEEIMEKRLLFDPSIMFCIECARAAESSSNA